MPQQLQYCTFLQERTIRGLLLCYNRQRIQVETCQWSGQSRSTELQAACMHARLLKVARPRNLLSKRFGFLANSIDNVAIHVHFPPNCAMMVARRIPDRRNALFAENLVKHFTKCFQICALVVGENELCA